MLRDLSGEERLLSHVYKPDIDDQGRVRGIFVFAVDVTERREAVRRLEHSENDLRRLMDSLPALISRVDQDYRYLYVNNCFCQFIGSKDDDIAGKRATEIIHDDAVDARKAHLDLAFAGQTVAFEATLPDAAGRERLLSQVYTPEIDSEGVVRSLVIFSTDITDQRESEEKIRRAEHDLRVIYNSVPLTIVRLDRELRYLYANAFFARLLVRTPDDIIGHHIDEVLGSEQSAARRPYYARALNGEIVNYEGTIRSPHAGVRIIAHTYIPEFRPEGQVESCIAIGVDVTEQRMTERRIRERENEIRLINDSAPIIIARLDRDRCYRYVNAHYAKLLARPAEYFVGRNASEVVGQAAFDLRRPYIERALAGETVTYEV